MRDLSNKTLIMIVGPTSIGKSTVMNEVARQNEHFGRVKSFTTRPPRSNDEPNQYFYVSEEELADMSAQGSVVTNVLASTGFRYGTIVESFGHSYNLLDTLSHSVDTYKKLGFKRTVTISLTAPSEEWGRWLKIRFPERGPEYRRRLVEAVESIRWSLEQTNDHTWLVNAPNTLEPTARAIIATAEGTADHQTTPPEAQQLLTTTLQLLEEKS